MVVRLRLARWGVRHEPFFGIVAIEHRTARDWRHYERLGTYNARTDKRGVKHIELNVERIKWWLSQGAEPSRRVAWLLAKANIMPPLAKQLHLTGHVSFNDPKTWDVELHDAEGTVLARLSADDARKKLSHLPHLAEQLPRDYPIVEPEATRLIPENIKLGGTAPARELSDAERLHILKRFIGLRN
ncbi:hypothetical protein HK097_008099 [Rhizophlyctis rosea]|uniref:Mitochondrial ribosomal protein S16 n=1 Tax=Rhizophlyctis rosea TaxID=64517 RepID=A0AAD5SDJ8_9FUNG|nr:hypothetical protein HK097_008099 [Rhizophlyctis rosea]